MADFPKQALPEFRLPTAYSQGFAQIRVYAMSDPDDTGPLAIPASRPKVDPDLIFAETVSGASDSAELYRAD